jgi:PAS domain S-box-containing protein
VNGKSLDQLERENDDLRQRLEVAEETLDAIRYGRVDALVVEEGPERDQVYTLSGADRPYRIMVEGMQEGAVALRADGVILYCNPYMARLLRTTPERLLGSSFHANVAPSGKPAFEALVDRRGEGFGRAEIALLAADGAHVPAYLTVSPMVVDNATLISVVATDLSEHQRRAAELAAANRELEAFSFCVSHDLQAPLRHIASFIQLLGDRAGPGLDGECRRYVEVVAESAARMGDLIDDLLELSRIGRVEMNPSPVSLGQLVREAISELAPETRGRAIEWEIAELPAVRGDRSLLRNVLVNLLANAVKYTRPRNPARIQVGARIEEGGVLCFVRDNGVGFDMRLAHKLFGVFERLHPMEEFEGTGIGLASVRRAIQRHGGRTWAEGIVNGGATFYFTSPNPGGDV